MQPSTNTLAAIHQLLQTYFDGLYFGDTARLAEVFHPQARYLTACPMPEVTAANGVVQLSMGEYFQRVEQRPVPADSHQPRQDTIHSIDLAGPTTALVKAECIIGSRTFTDYLSLIYCQQRWYIISKVFHIH